jgi:hypothetical protein
MPSTFRQGVRHGLFFIFVAMIAVLVPCSRASAQTHVVSPAELRQQAAEASRTRAANIQKLSEFLASSKADQSLRAAHMDAGQVQAAVSTLGDEELAQLASRAAKAQSDFAAGDLSDRDLLIILVGIAALILIIVAVR